MRDVFYVEDRSRIHVVAFTRVRSFMRSGRCFYELLRAYDKGGCNDGDYPAYIE